MHVRHVLQFIINNNNKKEFSLLSSWCTNKLVELLQIE